MSNLQTINFHNHNLYLVEHNGQPFTPMRPIVEGMGMDWASQFRKLQANSKRWGTVVIKATVAGDKKMREMLSMPVRKLPAFMASIHPSKVKPELRETIELYQEECDDALWSYWSKGHAVNPRIDRITPEQKGILHAIMDRRCANVPASKQGAVRSRLWRAINRHNGVNSYHETPASAFEDTKAMIESMDIKSGEIVEQKVTYLRPVTIQQAELRNKRFMLAYDHEGKESLTEIPDEAFVMSIPQMLKAVAQDECTYLSTDQIADAISTLTKRMRARCNWYQNRCKALTA